MTLLVIDLGLLLLAALSALVFRRPAYINRAGHLFIALGLAVGLIFTVLGLYGVNVFGIYPVFSHVSLGVISLRVDTLALFFLGVIQIGGIAASLFGIGYLSSYESGRSLRLPVISMALLFIAMQILTLANHAWLFLVFWELMALAGYWGIIFEKEHRDVQKGSFIFFAATHVGTLFLYVMFLTLHHETGSWEFYGYQTSVIPNGAFVFWCAFVGFGMKAGFMPFHFWLPEAHPVAPSHVSAVLSAVMLKTGIYGLIRVITWLPPLDFIHPSVFLAVALVTALLGIWNAMAQKDIKRMLAYSSIENIGIIGIGLSLWMFGLLYQKPLLAFLGFGSALFHVLNHMLFKSLLFFSSGTIYQYYHHRNTERMGGLLKRSKMLGVIVLIGSAAICGLPPLNGFASEFLIYSGFFEAGGSIGAYFPFFMLLSAVILALVGGLAVAAFSKVYSVVFLGNEKQSTLGVLSLSVFEKIAFILLTGLCIMAGCFPQYVLSTLETIYHDLYSQSDVTLSHSVNNYLSLIGFVSCLALLLMGLIYWIKSRLVMIRQSKIGLPWGCGYTAVTPRMQYSGSSFVNTITPIAGKIINKEKKIHFPEHIMPDHGLLETSVSDMVLQRVIRPLGKGLEWCVQRFKWLQAGKIQVYVAFVVFVLISYIFLSFYL